jgi:hypothetical protein
VNHHGLLLRSQNLFETHLPLSRMLETADFQNGSKRDEIDAASLSAHYEIQT